MENNSILIQVSAFSGLIGALLTQALTGLFSYVGDKRKSNLELKTTFRTKQIDIAENFFFVTGEKMAIVKKNIGYWQNWNNSRSAASLEFLNKEMVKLNTYLEKLDADNWKSNLVSLYFDVSFTNDALIASNDQSKERYLKVLDITDELKHALPESKPDIYLLYDQAVKDLCSHYEKVYLQMSLDLDRVKQGLMQEFWKK